MSSHQPLTSDFIEEQRKRLVSLRAEILGAEGQATEVVLLQDERGEEAEEYEDGAQGLDQKEVLQARRDVDSQRLANIDRALSKISAGTYGLSDASGKPIPKARLEATPEAVLTVDEAAAG
jgi:DnaK suppressor protein